MFWTLGLAHLIADYPLQSNRLVLAKRHWPGLTVHVAIHFAMMLLLAGRDALLVWPQLLALAAIHFAIDSFKNFNSARWPRLVVFPYVLDQLLHLLSIALVAVWIQAVHGIQRDQDWLIYAAAYVLATHVWFITERILAHDDECYRKEIEAHYLPRMVVRALALTLFLLAGRLIWTAATATPLLFIAGPLRLPYRQSHFRRRMLLQDLLGPLLLAILVLLTANL